MGFGCALAGDAGAMREGGASGMRCRRKKKYAENAHRRFHSCKKLCYNRLLSSDTFNDVSLTGRSAAW